MQELGQLPEGEEIVLRTLSPLPQLKPGIPLPSPEDLRGKILIKNKKNQFSGPPAPSQEPGGEAEGSGPPNVPVGEDTGEAAWEEWGWPRRGIWNGREGLGLEGRASLVLGSPPPPVLTELYVAVWAGEEGAELEEEEVEEEEEESGSLDEEGMKKMQSDEVCGEPRGPSASSTAEPSRRGRGTGPLGSELASSPSSPLLPRAQRAWR